MLAAKENDLSRGRNIFFRWFRDVEASLVVPRCSWNSVWRTLSAAVFGGVREHFFSAAQICQTQDSGHFDCCVWSNGKNALRVCCLSGACDNFQKKKKKLHFRFDDLLVMRSLFLSGNFPQNQSAKEKPGLRCARSWARGGEQQERTTKSKFIGFVTNTI